MKQKKKVAYLVLWIVAFLGLNGYAQFRVGNGDSLFIASGESILIGEPLRVDSGGVIIDQSSTGIDLRSSAQLNGAMYYAAAGDQQILPYPHRTLVIAGDGNKWMQSDITISGNLHLGGTAKLITGSHVLTLSETSSLGGSVPIGFAASSWIVTGNGLSGVGNTGLGGLRIDQIGPAGRNNPVLFPVGPTPTAYNPVTLLNTGITDDYTIQVSDQVVPGVPALKSINNTWNISEGTAGGSVVALVTQWNQQDEAVSFVRAVSGIVHSNGTTVDQHAGMGMALGSNPYTRSGTGFRNFSPFGVTSDARVLPVSEIRVQASTAHDHIQLNYQVSLQLNISGYEMQRSTDGLHFSTLGQQPVRNESVANASYEWIDEHPATGVNFYRIKVNGPNGSYYFSQIVNASYQAGKASVSAYPNPVTQPELYLNFKNMSGGLYSISLLSASGSRIQLKPIQHSGVNGVYRVELPRYLAQGSYYAEIRIGQNRIVQVELMVHY